MNSVTVVFTVKMCVQTGGSGSAGATKGSGKGL